MSTPRTIIYDAARLVLSAASGTPRGIDRVETDYAAHLTASWPGEIYALLPTPWGMRLFDRARFARALAYLQAGWAEAGDAAADPVLHYIAARLAGREATAPEATKARGVGRWARVIGLLGVTGLSFGRPLRAAGRGAVYLNIGQLGFAAWLTTHWLRRRPDMAAIFMLHDVIQIEQPEFVSPAGLRWARLMVDVVRRRATGLIATTDAACRSVVSALGRRPASILTLSLPLADIFTIKEPPDPTLAGRYFISCGAIEPRKNLRLLRDVWEILIDRHGAAAPKLVIVGPVSPRGQSIRAELQASPALRAHIIIASGLSSPALRKLVANARAALMPSFAEGFGLPAIEALALKTPVVLSDIPALREAASGFGIYHLPDDVAAWTATIERLTFDPQAAAALRDACANFQPMTSGRYFAEVEDFLANLPVAA